MGNFNQPDNCWRNNIAGHKKSKRFLGSINDNFLTQVIEGLMRRGALVDLILTNKDRLIGDKKVEGRLGCSDREIFMLHEMM